MGIQLEKVKSYISYKHLYIDEDGTQVIFLGYDMCATKTERAIIEVLVKNPNNPISAEDIISSIGIEMGRENLVFHISGINKKARAIGNRPLIKNINKIGYFLNEEM